MWESNPVGHLPGSLTTNLHVGKVWRDQTDELSVFTRSTADNVAYTEMVQSRLRP